MKLAVLTTGRQDWGILRSTCRALRDDARFQLVVFIGGMHVSPRFGHTETLVIAEGFSSVERLDWVAGPDEATSEQAARALALVGQALDRHRPDALVLVGDRFETAAAALAATLARVAIVHLHGGEETAGAFDNALRHAITKLSHLHLVSHEDHARRVLAMGEHRPSIHVVGAPGLDNLHRDDLAERAELEQFLGLELVAPVVVVTLHPATLGASAASEVAAVTGAMDRREATYVVTLPNVDPDHDVIRGKLLAACDSERRVAVEALGERRYWGLLNLADAMLGNSSSAIIEGAALGLPAVNLGDRQKGRLRGDNVIDVPDADAARVAAALDQALDPGLRERLQGTGGLFGDGHSARRIVEILASWTPPSPPVKPLIEIGEPGPVGEPGDIGEIPENPSPASGTSL